MYSLFFDIETVANPEALALMPEPKAPGNLKDPAKIADAILAKRQEQTESAALDPDYGKVYVISYAFNENDEPTSIAYGDEAPMLEEFWRLLAATGGQCVGYNITGFDLPFIMRRTMALGIKTNSSPNLAKYRVSPVTDLMGILYNWGPAKGLKTVAQLYGIPNTCPGVDGSQVAMMSLAETRKYCESDVRLVQELYKRMDGVYWVR